MSYRDDDAVLRERIEQLELKLARTAGQLMLVADERDALRDELERLTHDPRALARVRRTNQGRSGLFLALRILGGLGIGAVVLPMILTVVALAASGELGGAAVCSLVPILLVAAVVALKLPEIAQALELRFERKQRAKRAAELARQPRVRVGVDAELLGEPVEAATERHARAGRAHR